MLLVLNVCHDENRAGERLDRTSRMVHPGEWYLHTSVEGKRRGEQWPTSGSKAIGSPKSRAARLRCMTITRHHN